jgi:3-oxoacyl-[acyl-carrier protein] reductase
MNTNGVVLSLAGQSALVTGGSRGIGAATVRMFVQAGAKVTFNYHHAQEAAEKLVEQCGVENCRAVQADLSSTEGARELINAAVQRWGRLDHLVANHGIWPAEDIPVDQMSEAHWSRTIDTNLNSVFALVKHGATQMKAQAPGASGARGHIVLISSTSGQRGEAYHIDYSATKGALISMTKSLSSELARHQIYANCVAPGWVDTDMAGPALADERTRAAIFATIPMGRVGTPEEIGACVLFLCTPHAGFINGEVFNVNGGAVLVG